MSRELKYKPVNGFTQPICIHQVASYLVFGIELISFSTLVINYFALPLQVKLALPASARTLRATEAERPYLSVHSSRFQMLNSLPLLRDAQTSNHRNFIFCQIIAGILFYGSSMLLTALTYCCTKIDPTDTVVYKERLANVRKYALQNK